MLDCRKDAAGALRSAAAAVVDLVFPPLCLAYYRPLSSHDAICPRCWSDIDFIRAPLCARLGIPMPFDVGGTMISAAAAADPPDYDRARAVARFDGVKRELVHDLKFPDRHDSRRLFARWLAEAGAELLAGADAVIPVPLTRGRLAGRRFKSRPFWHRRSRDCAGCATSRSHCSAPNARSRKSDLVASSAVSTSPGPLR
jgi:predicted amidophosphoribosyltransferase